MNDGTQRPRPSPRRKRTDRAAASLVDVSVDSKARNRAGNGAAQADLDLPSFEVREMPSDFSIPTSDDDASVARLRRFTPEPVRHDVA
ncbi:MAG TPA: hypothetical protein VIV60_37245, partial [Polyangiaceae bacterium]